MVFKSILKPILIHLLKKIKNLNPSFSKQLKLNYIYCDFVFSI